MSVILIAALVCSETPFTTEMNGWVIWSKGLPVTQLRHNEANPFEVLGGGELILTIHGKKYDVDTHIRGGGGPFSVNKNEEGGFVGLDVSVMRILQPKYGAESVTQQDPSYQYIRVPIKRHGAFRKTGLFGFGVRVDYRYLHSLSFLGIVDLSYRVDRRIFLNRHSFVLSVRALAGYIMFKNLPQISAEIEFRWYICGLLFQINLDGIGGGVFFQFRPAVKTSPKWFEDRDELRG